MSRELRETLRAEKALYLPKTWKGRMIAQFVHGEEYQIYRFMCALRKAEFYRTKSKLMYYIYLRKVNIRGNRLSYFISPGSLGKGVCLWHRGIIINPSSRVGDGCVFHGDNCVGNDGSAENRCPVLGKNVDVGVGAVILGGVTLADGIRIGANAVVNKSFTEPGITIAGVPAVKVKDSPE